MATIALIQETPAPGGAAGMTAHPAGNWGEPSREVIIARIATLSASPCLSGWPRPFLWAV